LINVEANLKGSQGRLQIIKTIKGTVEWVGKSEGDWE